MTVLEAEHSAGTLLALDRRGQAADAATASLLEIRIEPDAGSQGGTRRMLWFLPAASLP
jgi:hypothetical protein